LDERLQEFAQGEYLKVGEEMGKYQEEVREGMMAPAVQK